MKVTLKPILHTDAMGIPLERELTQYFAEVIYHPLLDLIADSGAPETKHRLNYRMDDTAAGVAILQAALDSGQIWYADGYFTGRLSAPVSRELRAIGASFNAAARAFYIPLEQVPLALRTSVAHSRIRTEKLHGELISLLGLMAIGIREGTKLDTGKCLDKLDTSLDKQFDNAADGIEVLADAAGLTPAQRQAMADQLTENLELGIKNFALERIPELRQKVEQNLVSGGRIDRLQKIIETDYGVSQRKARFLAEQETSLYIAKYRKIRYAAVGINEYIWRTREDAKVRPDHAALNGRKFSFDHPPICDQSDGRRCNPGEDYGCRCEPLPILNLPLP